MRISDMLLPMALIRIVDSWLRSPASPPTHQRAVMVVAESWGEQRVLMRAFAECLDQTRPTIVLHGAQLAIGPAGTDPHGPWGIHVEPPIDGQAQSLREQLHVAARRLAGSKGNPPRLQDEIPKFESKPTNNWAPGTPRDLPSGSHGEAGSFDSESGAESSSPAQVGVSSSAPDNMSDRQSAGQTRCGSPPRDHSHDRMSRADGVPTAGSSAREDKTLPGPVPVPDYSRQSADGLPLVPSLQQVTADAIPNPAYHGQRAAAHRANPSARSAEAPPSPRGWESPLQHKRPLRDRAEAMTSPPASPAVAATRTFSGAKTITGFASGADAASRHPGPVSPARSRSGFASVVTKTMPVGFQLTDQERVVLDALAACDSLSAGQIAELIGVDDGAAWMSPLVAKLAGYGLDVVSVSQREGVPFYALRR